MSLFNLRSVKTLTSMCFDDCFAHWRVARNRSLQQVERDGASSHLAEARY